MKELLLLASLLFLSTAIFVDKLHELIEIEKEKTTRKRRRSR